MNRKTIMYLIKKRRMWCIYSFFLLISILSIYPVLLANNSWFIGDDLGFHLGRIEGLAQSLKQGAYLGQINYFLAGGLGYASGIFYPNFFLYLAAVLRLLNLSLIQAYIIFVILINLLTFIIAYHSFYKISKKRLNSFLFALIYGLSTYRMTDVVYRAAVGEYLAMMLMPLIFLGIYYVIYGNEKQWPLLALGMTLLCFAHTLSVIIISFFLFGFCLLNSRRILTEKRRLVCLVLATGMTILMAIVSWLPVLEQLMFQRLRVSETPVFYLQRAAETLLSYIEIAVRNYGFNNLGLFTFVSFAGLCVAFKYLTCLHRQLLLLSGIFLFLSTSHFPHTIFHDTFLNSIQFPSRYFALITFTVGWVLADVVGTWISLKKNRAVPIILIFVILFGFNWSMENKMKQIIGRELISYEKFEQNYTGAGRDDMGYGKEFLPSGMTEMLKPTSLLLSTDTTKVTNVRRSNNIFYLDFDAPEKTNIIFPLLFYKGYQSTGFGQISATHMAGIFKEKKMHGFLEVTVKGKGHLEVRYQGTLIQKISLLISLFSSIVFCVFWLKSPKQYSRNKKN